MDARAGLYGRRPAGDREKSVNVHGNDSDKGCERHGKTIEKLFEVYGRNK